LANLVEALNSGRTVVAAELRPPRANLAAAEGMDAWIDTYHAVRRLTRDGAFVFLTDSAVGTPEEDNLRHLVTNLGPDAPYEQIVPFLTSKHPLEYCLGYAQRAAQHRFPALVVLGGDRHVGVARSVEHAFLLRQAIRRRESGLLLGGWANPYADPVEQVRHLADPGFAAEFYLTQIVTHYAIEPVERFLAETRRQRLTLPGALGVFFFRSANPRTLGMLREFLPVPVDALTQDFASGATAEEICARTISSMMDLGVRHFYISNLPLGEAQETLGAILARAGLA
jgi:hypothetical protein